MSPPPLPRKRWTESITPATRCPACGTEDRPGAPPADRNILPLVVPQAGRPLLEPGVAVVTLFNSVVARARKFLGSGNSFAFRAYVCRTCSFVLWHYDEETSFAPPDPPRSPPGAAR